MPLPFLLTSSDNFVGGGQYTRFKGAVLAGTYVATTSAGTLSEGVAGVGLVQPGTVTSTAGVRSQVISTAIFTPAAVAPVNYVYIPQTTGAIATSSDAAGSGAPPLSGMGAALIWDAGNRRLGVYSTVTGTWMFTNVTITTSAGSGGFTSS